MIEEERQAQGSTSLFPLPLLACCSHRASNPSTHFVGLVRIYNHIIDRYIYNNSKVLSVADIQNRAMSESTSQMYIFSTTVSLFFFFLSI